MDFYTNHIQSNSDWCFVKIFANRSTTGTNTKNRERFNEMIDLTVNGGINLILTKIDPSLCPEYLLYTFHRPAA